MHKEFQVGEHAYLRINPKKSSLRIGKCAKRLDLTQLVRFHDVFHVSFLKIYVHDSSHVIDWCVL